MSPKVVRGIQGTIFLDPQALQPVRPLIRTGGGMQRVEEGVEMIRPEGLVDWRGPLSCGQKPKGRVCGRVPSRSSKANVRGHCAVKVGRRWTDPGGELGDGQRGVGGVLSQECHQLKADRERKVPVDMRLRRIRDHLTLAGIGGGFMCG